MQVTQIDWFSVLGGKQLIQKIQDFLENTNSLIPATLENTILLFAVLLVLASELYDDSDYIRNYDEFLKFVQNCGDDTGAEGENK